MDEENDLEEYLKNVDDTDIESLIVWDDDELEECYDGVY